MFELPNLDIPESWERLDLSGLKDILMVIGGPDTGKTTFARYLYEKLVRSGKLTAFLDGDPGQTTLGPPGTMTLSLSDHGDPAFSLERKTWRWFVGSTSPSGHMLPVLVGSARLAQEAQSAGSQAIVYDTSGLIDPSQGGNALKLAKIDLLRPSVVFAIQKESELEPVLQPLRRSRRTNLVTLQTSEAARSRPVPVRQEHRAQQFAQYFKNFRVQIIEWHRYAVFPFPRFALNRLVALEDEAGFTLGLGIIQAIDRPNRRISLLTPLNSLEQVTALHIGDLLIDLQNYRDVRI
jgi:polynucleotide 5'-hydroxyl-kinase GRC3/NOL9